MASTATEARVQQHEMELRQILDLMPQLVAVFGPDRERLFANRPALHYLGITIEQWQGISDPLWFFHPADRERIATHVYARPKTDAVPHEFEARIRQGNGTYRWFLCFDNPVRDEGGRLTRWYLSATDIEDRKRAEEELRFSEALLARERDRLTLLLEINNHIISKLEVNELFRAVAASMRKHLDADAAGLWLLNKQSGSLERRLLDFPTGKGILAKVAVSVPAELETGWWRRRSPQTFRPQEATGLPTPIRDASRAEGILSAVSVPLLGASGAVLGLMTLSSRKADAFGRSELDSLSQIATQISLALDNALAYEALRASHDALRRSEAYLAEAQRLSHTGSWAFDLASNSYVYLSEECARIFGIDPQGGVLPRDAVSRLIHTDDWESVNEAFEKAVREKVDTSSEMRITTADGTVKHVLTSRHPVLDDAGNVVQLVGTVIDISERKRTEEERREHAERFRAIADYTYDWENWFGVDGKLLWVNPAVERITGYSVDECMAMPDFPVSIIAEADRQTIAAQMREAVQGSSQNDFEFRVRHKKGHLAWVAASWQPIYDSQSARLGYRSSIRDIAERKRAEDERSRAELAAQNARAELERVSRVMTMGELAASIAHEINQPLAGLITSANAGLNWLAGDPANLSKAREALARVVRDGTRAGEVVSRIRGAVKRPSSVKQRVNVNEIVREVLTLMRSDLQQGGVEVTMVLDPALPAIVGDNIQLQQVFLNVVQNALEAIAERHPGTLRIQSAVSSLDGNPAVLVTVCDNGAGFGHTNPETLFEAFQTTKPYGMGMGLWISRWIVERHKGRLTAHSNNGPGATFRILLPATGGDAP